MKELKWRRNPESQLRADDDIPITDQRAGAVIRKKQAGDKTPSDKTESSKMKLASSPLLIAAKRIAGLPRTKHPPTWLRVNLPDCFDS